VSTDIQPFDFSGQQVRVVTDEAGEPWFVVADIARVLGYRDAANAARLVEEDERGYSDVSTPGGPQRAITVNESGVYALIFRSNHPQAVEFRKFVTGTVLPAIRKTGSYGIATNPAEISRADLARMVLAAEEELAVVSAALTAAQPAVEYHERFVANDDAVTVKVWGAQFGLTQQQAFDQLIDRKVIYRQSIGQRWSAKAGRVVTEHEYRARAGRQSFAWFDLRPQHNAPRHHNGQVRQTLYVRQAYALDLAKLLGLTEQLPAVTE